MTEPAFQLSLVEPVGAVPAGDTDHWFTPSKLYAALHREFRFTLDPCCTEESAKCRRFFTEKEDGLAQSWAGERVFCNPPYSSIYPWTEKCLAESRRCPVVVGLLPAWTDRPWWQLHIEPFRKTGQVEVRFLPGRLKFGFPGSPSGKGGHSARFPSVVVIWASDVPADNPVVRGTSGPSLHDVLR